MALAWVHMEYSLQSWDLIADQVETAAGSHHLNGMVVVPGCNKNMPGVLMAHQCFSIFPISSIGTSIHVYFKLDNSGTPESSQFDGVQRLHPSRLVKERNNLTLYLPSNHMANTLRTVKLCRWNANDTIQYDMPVLVLELVEG